VEPTDFVGPPLYRLGSRPLANPSPGKEVSSSLTRVPKIYDATTRPNVVSSPHLAPRGSGSPTARGGGGNTNTTTKEPTKALSATPAQDRDLLLDFEVGSDAVRKQFGSTWWSWDSGLTLNFWRWPEGEQRKAARNGMPAYISGPLPHYFRKAKKPSSESYSLLVKKLSKMTKQNV
jgi:hypothetical protein